MNRRKKVKRLGAKTISFPKGKGHLTHNNREFISNNVVPERTAWNRIYIQESLEQAYEKCFGQALMISNGTRLLFKQLKHLDELVRTRIIVLRAANKLSDDEDMSVVEEESYAYYRRALESGEHIAYLVYDNGKFIGAGGLSFYQVMPTYHNPTGKKAYIMNMYTASEYRRQGIAFHTLDLLVNDARKQGVSQIALEATDMGRPLYEKYGFVKMEDEMELV